MTNPPQSPYGPSGSAVQNPPHPQHHPAPQPPYNAAEFYPQQVPHGYTIVGPAQPKASNGPGLASLIIGITSVVLALIPFVGFLSYLLGPSGIIVGIVGLVLADRPRRQAGWGLALSVASIVVAMVMFWVYIYAFAAVATSEGWN